MNMLLVCAIPAAALAANALPTITTPGGVEMAHVPAGAFEMGDPDGLPDAKPVHRVEIDSFYMDVYEVTQAEYERVMGENPSRWKHPKQPVEQVRWSDAVRYCNARSKRDGLAPAYDLDAWTCDFTASGYRLPTEAEWEYAARAGTKTRWFFGAADAKLKGFAWFKETSGGKPRPVGLRHPNPWGFYDVYGNVWEWCHDLYAPMYYRDSPQSNPRGPGESETRVLRGGSWDARAPQCSSTFRYSENPGYADICFGYDIYGFRAVRRAEN